MKNCPNSPSLSVDGYSATIRLRSPEHSNRLGPVDLAAIRMHLDAVNSNTAIRVLRFEAEGKTFCSGYDISCFGAAYTPGALYFGETIDLIEAARPITIAAIHGGIYGGGTDLCLACDFRIGTPQAEALMPAASLGLHLYPGALSRYVSRLGLNQAKRLFLMGERVRADEMLRIGFLTELIDASRLESRLIEISERMAAMAPIPLLGMKAQLNRIARGDFDIRSIEEAVLLSEASEDFAEGLCAWKERRIPNFKHR